MMTRVRRIATTRRTDVSPDYLARDFHGTFGVVPVAVRLADRRGHLVAFNKPFSEMVGIRPDDLSGMSYLDFTHPDDLDVSMDAVEVLAAGDCEEVEFEKHRVINGQEQTVTIRLVAIRDSAGALVYSLGTVADITAQRAAEAATERRDRIRAAVSVGARQLLNQRSSAAWLDDLGVNLVSAVGASSMLAFRCGSSDEAPAVAISLGRPGQAASLSNGSSQPRPRDTRPRLNPAR